MSNGGKIRGISIHLTVYCVASGRESRGDMKIFERSGAGRRWSMNLSPGVMIPEGSLQQGSKLAAGLACSFTRLPSPIIIVGLGAMRHVSYSGHTGYQNLAIFKFLPLRLRDRIKGFGRIQYRV